MANTPKIRFEGFTDDWEQRKLGDIIDKLTGGASIAPDDYEETGYRTIPKGAVNDTGVADVSGCKYVSEEFFRRNISSKTSAGELVTSLRDLVPTAPNMGRIVRIEGEPEEFLMPQGVYSIILNKYSDEDFLIAYSNSPGYRKIITSEKNGSTQVHIRNGEFLDIGIPVPSFKEQRQIGATMKYIDNLITLHQRKCDETKELKNYMLQKMFPKAGEKVPEILFAGFTIDWEQCKLGDCLSEITYGFTNPMSDTDEGPWKITAKDVVNGRIDFSTARHTSEAEFKILTDKSKPHVGDLLLTKDGTLGRTAIVNTENICINQSVALLRCNEDKCSQYYLKTLLDSPVCQEKMLGDAGGGTIKHIYITKVDKMVISIPSKEEQQKLFSFFENLENLITLHQCKCDNLKILKQYMLQNMFPQKG